MIRFDPVTAITIYRRIIARRDAATTDADRNASQAEADRLKTQWKEWSGCDDLHEVACESSARDHERN